MKRTVGKSNKIGTPENIETPKGKKAFKGQPFKKSNRVSLPLFIMWHRQSSKERTKKGERKTRPPLPVKLVTQFQFPSSRGQRKME